MKTATYEIGDDVPDTYWRTVPVVRLETWGPAGYGLTPFAADRRADGPADWSGRPRYVVDRVNVAGYRPIVNVEPTGTVPVRWGDARWVRGRIEFIDDGAPSQFAPCWILCK
jgi:hypothetical protein